MTRMPPVEDVGRNLAGSVQRNEFEDGEKLLTVTFFGLSECTNLTPDYSGQPL